MQQLFQNNLEVREILLDAQWLNALTGDQSFTATVEPSTTPGGFRVQLKGKNSPLTKLTEMINMMSR